ncbi:hypothetical protein VNI00_005350 [Paramarasmius palmivorus]|uniref:Isomerase YbhE n=1 Tax=Paramarasmius palmivorus TaxID=297713 RepID=A0AAW0DBL8_9AGAR
MAFTILAGGHDTFINTYLFDPWTASLSVTGNFTTGENPTAVNEVSAGALQSFTTTPDGVISGPFDTVSSGGDTPAFTLALSTGEVAVMNYVSGDGRVIPTTSNPLKFDNSSAPIITFPAPTNPVDIERQDGSHPHQVAEHGDEILVPDLGDDVVWRLKQKGGEWSIAGSIPQPSGSGPRHAVARDNRLFTLHELSSTLTVQAFPELSLNVTAPIIASASIIPKDAPAGSQWGASEILIPALTEKFPRSFIYASNRNIATDPKALDPRGDTIAIFEYVGKGTEQEGLKLVKQVYTGLSQIRGMEIGPISNGGDEFLIAAGVAGTGGTAVFRRIDGGADLEEVARNTEIPTRSTFLWVEKSHECN